MNGLRDRHSEPGRAESVKGNSRNSLRRSQTAVVGHPERAGPPTRNASVLRLADARKKRAALAEVLDVLDVVAGGGQGEVREREDRALRPEDRAEALRFETLPHRREVVG